MKIKNLLFMSLLFAAISCSKDEPVEYDIEDPWWEGSWGGSVQAKMQTPKGWVDINTVNKEELPTWLQSFAEDLIQGYIMKAGTGENILYFVYDSYKKYGRHYDAQGNTTADNPKLKDWRVIYHKSNIYYW